jgi:hypothetical protein
VNFFVYWVSGSVAALCDILYGVGYDAATVGALSYTESHQRSPEEVVRERPTEAITKERWNRHSVRLGQTL